MKNDREVKVVFASIHWCEYVNVLISVLWTIHCIRLFVLYMRVSLDKLSPHVRSVDSSTQCGEWYIAANEGLDLRRKTFD